MEKLQLISLTEVGKERMRGELAVMTTHVKLIHCTCISELQVTLLQPEVLPKL